MNKRQKEIIQYQENAERKILKELEKQYRAALDDINMGIRIMMTDEQTQSKVYRIQYQKALRSRLEAVLEKLHATEFESINAYLRQSYVDSFVGTMYDHHGQGIPLIMPFDENAAVKAVVTDSQLSEDLYTSLGVDTQNLKKAIRQEITRGIASSMAYADIARNISQVAKTPLNRAKTIVDTEAHRIQEAARYDAMLEAKAKGCEEVKIWTSLRNGNVRDAHRQLDGQIREVDEPFEYGNKKAMYPGDFGVPELDIRCHCKGLTRAKWLLDETLLEEMKDKAAYFNLDKTERFEEFREKYLIAVESEAPKVSQKTVKPLKKLAENGIMDTAEGDAYQALPGDIKAASIEVDKLLAQYISRPSKWSGTTVIRPVSTMPNAMGRKEWNCDITIREDAGTKIIVHEHLHARSVSYYSPMDYLKWQRAEEGAVELLAQEICKMNGIAYRESYPEIVKQLRIANSILDEYPTEYEFARAFYEVEMPDRYAWLKAKADKLIGEGKLKSKTEAALTYAVEYISGGV